MTGAQVSRLVATLFIWTAFTLVMMSALSSQPEGWVMVVMSAILGAAAAGSTAAIWVAVTERPAQLQEQIEKSKRTSRIEKMMSSLDDRELEELRARLMAEDGEMVSLDSLMSEKQRRG